MTKIESQARLVAAAWKEYKGIDRRLSLDGKAKLLSQMQRPKEDRIADARKIKAASAWYKTQLNILVEVLEGRSP